MGPIDRRVGALEARHRLGPRDQERRAYEERREVFKRMTDEELDACERAFVRLEATGSFGDEDRPIRQRAEELLREVRGGAA